MYVCESRLILYVYKELYVALVGKSMCKGVYQQDNLKPDILQINFLLKNWSPRMSTILIMEEDRKDP